MDESLEQRVIDVVADTLNVDAGELDANTSAQTLHAWSSLAHLMLMAAIEQSFGVELTMDEMAEMISIRAIVDRLVAHGVAA